MADKNETISSEKFTTEESTAITQKTNEIISENVTCEAASDYSDSILVSVNASGSSAVSDDAVDDVWINENDLNEYDDMDEPPDPMEDTSEIIVYDIKAFEEDFDEPDASNKGTTLNAKKIGCISCSVVLLLMILLAVSLTTIFYHYYRLMEFDDDEDMLFNDRVTFSDTDLKQIPDGNVEIEEGTIFKDKNVLNILLIGTDERTKGFSQNARADSIMILSLDNNTKSIRLVSLERGMLVSIPGRKNDILTHTFRYGGSKLLMETVRSHLKVDVDKYIRVNFSMFQKLVDEVGGVDITLTKQEAYGLNTYPNHNTWKLKRKVHEGINHFDGYEALQYARLRWIDDDFHRIERQRKVIIAIKENMTDLTVSDLKDILEDCLPYIQTNLSAMEFAEMLIKLPGYIDNDVAQMTIPQKGTYKTLGHVDFQQNAIFLNDFLYGPKENTQ